MSEIQDTKKASPAKITLPIIERTAEKYYYLKQYDGDLVIPEHFMSTLDHQYYEKHTRRYMADYLQANKTMAINRGKRTLTELDLMQYRTTSGWSTQGISYEFSSRSVCNQYYALYERFLKPSLTPDPIELDVFDRLMARYFEHLERKLTND